MTELRFQAEVLRDFARRVLTAAGADEGAAALCADVFVAADLCGTDTHGVVRLVQYARALLSGRVTGDAKPEAVAQWGGVAAVDAHNALGPAGLCFATDLAVDLARRHGVAVVTVRGSNHAGSVSWYAERAAAAGMFALVLTGATKAMVAPTHGAAPFLGTNAVAYAVPAAGEVVSFDAAMSAATRSMLEAHERSGTKLREGWAIGSDGEPAFDAGEVIAGIDGLFGHSLLPFGGTEHGGHKGYGIGLLVELLCGPIAGGRWGRTPPDSGPAGVGHFVLCLDMAAFGDTSEQVEKRVAELSAGLRAVPPVAGQVVRVPGDRRRECAARRTDEGIPIPREVLATLDSAAALTKVTPLDVQSATSRRF